MIFYGTKSTQIGTESLFYKCSNCGTQNSLEMLVFLKYAHVYWIPFFPLGKTGATQCSNCKQVVQNKEFTENLKASYTNLKSGSKTPVWMFSGIAIIALLITWGTVVGKQNDKKYAQLIMSAEKGDIYEIKLDYKQYTLLKVDKVVGDTVFVLLNQYETNKSRGLSDIKRKGDQAFIQEPLPMLKEELKTKLEKGEIIGIDRD